MRTRRSPRNQERLWRELGGEREKPPQIDHLRVLERALELCMNKRTRKQIERDIANEKHRRAVRAALALTEAKP